jgi:hypothetical protein
MAANDRKIDPKNIAQDIEELRKLKIPEKTIAHTIVVLGSQLPSELIMSWRFQSKSTAAIPTGKLDLRTIEFTKEKVKGKEETSLFPEKES